MIGALYAFLPKPVMLTVFPGYAQMAPATFVFVVIAPRDPANREACFGYDGPEQRSFCWTLDGDKSRRSWRFEWPLRVSGEYEAVASVTRMADGRAQTYVDRQPFRVIGFEVEP